MGKKKTPNKPQKKHGEKKNDPEKWIHKRNQRPERKKKRPREVDPQAKFETRKEEKKKRPREVDPHANFETRKEEKKTTQRSGSTSEITRKEKNDPEKWIHKRNLRPERKKKKRPREVDPQAKLETRKEEKKTTQRS